MTAQIICLADKRPTQGLNRPLTLAEKKRLERLLIRDIARKLSIGDLPPLPPEPRDEWLRAIHASGAIWGMMS